MIREPAGGSFSLRKQRGEEMEKFNFKNKILIGVTLFSMFFGAGNLIFPPFLGAQAGTHTWSAFLGFAISAVGVPVLGVIAVTVSGGLEKLASRVHPKFAFLYILILYLAIGPCLAIPRTASTSFSMAVIPFMPEGMSAAVPQLLYSLVFFGLATAVAMHPEKLTEYLGKRLTPILLVLIVVLYGAALMKSADVGAGEPASIYLKGAAVQGFLDGYQTMDTLAALNFGMIVALNIRVKGIQKEKAVVKETISAGWIAGVLLLAVYAMLAYVGRLSGASFAGAKNGTEVLVEMAGLLFGKLGTIILAVIFVIACFNTCVGLFSCCGKYFAEIFPKPGYKGWVFIFAFVSMVIANVGLDMILKFSVPVLNAIYPMAILLILLALLHRWLGRFKGVYPWAAALCGISSVLIVLTQQGILIPGVSTFVKMIPAYKMGFGWLIPTAVGILAGMLTDIIKKQTA